MTQQEESGRPLACPVRGCYQPLKADRRQARCVAGHSFDIARSGYINLLQPQDRRSRDAGDSKDVVEARRATLSAGIGQVILDGILTTAALLVDDGRVVVDLGAGAGDALIGLAHRRAIVALGLDLSVAAAMMAATRAPELTWIVANADRRLPFLDQSVDLVLSLHGRRNATECARVLKPTGHLIVAIPGAEDLIELRERVQGQRLGRDRGPSLIDEHDAEFLLETKVQQREHHDLEQSQLRQLLRGTYRGARRGAAATIDSLGAMGVTLESDVFVFKPR